VHVTQKFDLVYHLLSWKGQDLGSLSRGEGAELLVAVGKKAQIGCNLRYVASFNACWSRAWMKNKKVGLGFDSCKAAWPQKGSYYHKVVTGSSM
jgi:hypothetical protein